MDLVQILINDEHNYLHWGESTPSTPRRLKQFQGVIPKENLALKVIIYFKSGAEFVFNSPSPFDFPNDAPIEEINDIIKKGDGCLLLVSPFEFSVIATDP